MKWTGTRHFGGHKQSEFVVSVTILQDSQLYTGFLVSLRVYQV